MENDKRNADQSDAFDIVDFDLNEYDEEFEKDEQRLQLKEEKKIQAEKSRVQQAKEQKNKDKGTMDDRMMPNRDMLKTILMILILIVVACLFLGFITLIVNSVGSGSKSKKNDAEITSEATTEKSKWFRTEETEATTQSASKKDEQKENLEKSIEDITNKVKNDTCLLYTSDAADE